MSDLQHYFADPAFWVHISFFVFLFIAFVKGHKGIKVMLDGKINEIIKEVENAQQLREEALGVLAEAKYKEQLSETQRRDMAQEADEKIRHIEDQAQHNITHMLAMQRKRMDDKIKRLEIETQHMIRKTIISCSVEVTENILRHDFHEAEDRDYIKQIITNLPQNYTQQ